MKASRKQASARLFRKLQALRVTLPDDEREILDSIITDEVQGHRMHWVKALASTSVKQTASKEVKANSMNLARVSASTSRKQAASKEVKANSMNLARVSASTSRKQSASKDQKKD